jgi:hypothetical protein
MFIILRGRIFVLATMNEEMVYMTKLLCIYMVLVSFKGLFKIIY